MNRSIEFHDSSLGGLAEEGKEVVVRFEPAYVHESAGRPGLDPGTGWVQPVELRVQDCEATTVQSELPADVWGGWLESGVERHENGLPLPFSFRGRVHLRLELSSGEVLDLRGKGVSAASTGPAKYVEEFPGSA